MWCWVEFLARNGVIIPKNKAFDKKTKIPYKQKTSSHEIDNYVLFSTI